VPGRPGRAVRDRLLEKGALVPVHVEPRAGVFQIVPLAPEGSCTPTRGL
jgi:hypothetical protein